MTAIGYNEANIKALKEAERTQHIAKLDPSWRWIATADDPAYIRPAENYYLHHTWRDNNPGRQAYFLRTPGYGLFRYWLFEMLGFEGGQLYFRYVQVLLFSLSVFLLYRCGILIGLPAAGALIAEAIYGLSPFAVGFLYYSLTEGITPALMIGYMFLMLVAYRRGGALFFLLAALLMGYIGLVRPVLLIFAPALLLTAWWSAISPSLLRRWLFIALNALIMVLPLTMWAYRSYQIAGEWVGIYPIYYAENNSQFRPSHQAIWRFASSFGMEGRVFHESMVPLWQAAIRGDTSERYIDSILLTIPGSLRQEIGEARLRVAYRGYRSSIIFQRSHYPRGVPMPDTIPSTELGVIRDFDRFSAEIRAAHWPWCQVAVPLIVFKRATFHSNLSLWIFQHTWRGRWWMEAARLLFSILHLACCLSFIPLLYRGPRVVRLMAGWLVALYFFYLCYYFRSLEERYTLPVLPLMLLGLSQVASSLYDLASKRFNKIGIEAP